MTGIVVAFRVTLSAVYGIDIAIRSALAPRHAHYALTHPLALIAVIIPSVRVSFSLRLVRSMFRRGHLGRFLVAAAALVLNGAVIVYLFERHAPHSSIHSLEDALWWSLVTVTTVGYGDFYPVTNWARVTACFIMATGLLTLAVTARGSLPFGPRLLPSRWTTPGPGGQLCNVGPAYGRRRTVLDDLP